MNPTPPSPPLDYRPVGADPARHVFSFPLAAYAGIIGALLTAMAWCTRFKFEAIFKDFKIELPAVTKVVLVYSRSFMAGGGAVVWLLLIALTFLPAIGFDDRRNARWIHLCGILAIVLLILFYMIAIFSPMIVLIETVSSPHH